jgi:hypothetical protein
MGFIFMPVGNSSPRPAVAVASGNRELLVGQEVGPDYVTWMGRAGANRLRVAARIRQ